MGLLKRLAQDWVDVCEFEDYIELQKLTKKTLNQYWERYWYIGLVLWELVIANSSILKVHSPKVPKGLQLPNFKPRQKNVFLYRLVQNNSCNDGEAPPSPLKVRGILEGGFFTCGFNGIEVKCRPDDNCYNVAVICGDGCTLGHPMSVRTGQLFFNEVYNAFDVRFSDGSTHGGIRDNVSISIYHEGQPIPSYTRRDVYGNPFLSRLPPNLRPDYGYLVLI